MICRGALLLLSVAALLGLGLWCELRRMRSWDGAPDEPLLFRDHDQDGQDEMVGPLYGDSCGILRHSFRASRSSPLLLFQQSLASAAARDAPPVAPPATRRERLAGERLLTQSSSGSGCEGIE
jgi:hypothetical protein